MVFRIKNNYSDFDDWKNIIHKIVALIILKNKSSNDILEIIKKCREYIYILNKNINLKIVIKYLMKELIQKVDDLDVKYKIVYITSEFEYNEFFFIFIIHIESYILKIVQLFYKNNNLSMKDIYFKIKIYIIIYNE